MEKNNSNFEEIIQQIITDAKNKRGVIEYKEIFSYFKDNALDDDQEDKVLEELEKAGIDVLGMELCNGEMTIYSGNRCRIFYPNGKIKYDGEGEENMVLVTRTHINDKYFVISGNHIDVIKFN